MELILYYIENEPRKLTLSFEHNISYFKMESADINCKYVDEKVFDCSGPFIGRKSLKNSTIFLLNTRHSGHYGFIISSYPEVYITRLPS